MDDFFSNNFMPHGHCYYWSPHILWPHAISNSIIALAYCAIPLTLIYIFKKRNDFSFIWMMILFAIFILGCGITHIFDVVVIWNPLYSWDVIFRVITALASIGTAIVLVRVTPRIIAIPSTRQWKDLNQSLKEQIKQLQEKDKTIEKIKEFEFLSDFIPQLIWWTLPNGDHKYFNQRWYEYTGLSLEETIDKGWSKVLHPEDYLRTLNVWNNSLQTGESYEIEYRLKNKEGSYRWFLGRALPMKDEYGNITKWFGTCTDIEDQKIYNERLEAKNKELITINNDLDNFVYTASHDLKSPITNLEGLFYLLAEESKEEEHKETMGMISNSINRLKNTINDLGDISKIQRNVVEIEEVKIEEVYNEVKEDIRPMIEESQAIIEVFLVEDFIKFSKKNLRTVLYNLLSNAVKYRSSKRRLHITLSSYLLGDYTVIAVKDNGLGIPERGKTKIFGMFKRLHDHVEGTGIGLYIVKKIMENHNGKIELESEEDKGAEFKVYFKN